MKIAYGFSVVVFKTDYAFPTQRERNAAFKEIRRELRRFDLEFATAKWFGTTEKQKPKLRVKRGGK